MKVFLNITISTLLSSVFLFSGCGSATSGSNSNEVVGTTSGTVSGSYYEGAIVCFDTNGDGSCSGEVTTVTDAKGDFTLKGDGKYPIIAQIPAGAIKHEVLGDAGTNITDATKTVFAIPANALAQAKNDAGGKVVVSAISTRMYTYMKDHPNDTINAAMNAVAGIVGISKKDLLKDFNSADLKPSVRAELKAKADALLEKIKGKANIEEVKTAADNFVAAMSIPENIDAVKASE